MHSGLADSGCSYRQAQGRAVNRDESLAFFGDQDMCGRGGSYIRPLIAVDDAAPPITQPSHVSNGRQL